jgi:hypothetical protein
MKKFSVSAAHRVSTKNPRRRSTNLIASLPSCPPWTASLLCPQPFGQAPVE